MRPYHLEPSGDLAKIELLCCDVDGVMTDGSLFYDDNGNRFVRFCVLDGTGLKRLQAAGITIAFISQSKNHYIAKRALDLGVEHCHLGVDDKSDTLRYIAQAVGVPLNKVAHIADDINDISLLKIVGIPVTVPDGVSDVKAICRYVTKTPGGHGAVRELCDAILESRRRYA